MVFVKEELDFLSLFAQVVNQKSPMYDKVHIDFQRENNQVVFTQFGGVIALQKKIHKTVTEDCTFVLPTFELNRLIDSVDKEKEIIIDKDRVQIDRSKYSFPVLSLDFSVPLAFIKKIEDEVPVSKVELKQLDLLNTLRTFIGDERGVDTVAFQDGYYVTSDRVYVICALRVNNEKGMFYMSRDMVDIFVKNKIKTAEITILKGFHKFYVNDVTIVVEDRKYQLPYILDDDMKEIYEHKYSFSVNKMTLLNALHRISIATKVSLDNRLIVRMEKDEIVLASDDNIKACEPLPAEVDVPLIGHYFSVQSQMMNSVMRIFMGTEKQKRNVDFPMLYFKVKEDTTGFAIKVYDDMIDDFCVMMLFSYGKGQSK